MHETHSQSNPSCQPHMQFGEKTFSAFESNAYGLMGFEKVRSGFCHHSKAMLNQLRSHLIA